MPVQKPSSWISQSPKQKIVKAVRKWDIKEGRHSSWRTHVLFVGACEAQVRAHTFDFHLSESPAPTITLEWMRCDAPARRTA